MSVKSNSSAKPCSAVKQYNGAPTIFVDGVPIPGAGFWRAPSHNECYLADFARIGVQICWFSVGTESWKASETYDFSELDAAWERMFAAMPEGYFIPRLYLRPPDWWIAAHPTELRLCEDGTPYQGTEDEYLQGQTLPSPTSPVWRSDTLAYIRAFVQHHEEGPYASRIIGYHLSNEQSEEWFYWGGPSVDYHPSAQEDFRHYLKAIYADDAALRAAWNNPQVSLAAARIPGYQERRHPQEGDFYSPTAQHQVVDYYRYKHELMVKVICEFAAEVKRLTARRALVGIFYGYQLQPIPRGQLDSGHYALRKLLESPDIDYLSSPTCYSGRELGTGYSYFMSPQASVRLHGKLWIDENDIRTHVQAPGNEGFGKTTTLTDTLAMQRREFANALCNGAAFWWMDQGGGWYDDPALLAELEHLREMMAKAVHCDRSSAAEIAIVLDERSVMWRGPHKGLQSFEGITDIGHIGAPVDFVLLEDLEKAQPYKLYLMKYCYRSNRTVLEMLDRVVKRNDSWVLWLDRPGWVREDTCTLGVANAEELTGLAVQLEGGVAGADAELSARLRYPARQFAGWTSIYLKELPTADDLRRLCRAAGVHIYLDSGDTIYADASFIGIHTARAGAKRLNLTNDGVLYDLVNRHEIAVKGSEAIVEMEARATALYYRGSAKQWEQAQR